MNEVYERAQELTQAGYSVIPVKNHNKGYFTTDWQHKQFPLEHDMTGLDIKTNVPPKNCKLHFISFFLPKKIIREAFHNQEVDFYGCFEKE